MSSFIVATQALSEIRDSLTVFKDDLNVIDEWHSSISTIINKIAPFYSDRTLNTLNEAITDKSQRIVLTKTYKLFTTKTFAYSRALCDFAERVLQIQREICNIDEEDTLVIDDCRNICYKVRGMLLVIRLILRSIQADFKLFTSQRLEEEVNLTDAIEAFIGNINFSLLYPLENFISSKEPTTTTTDFEEVLSDCSSQSSDQNSNVQSIKTKIIYSKSSKKYEPTHRLNRFAVCKNRVK